MRTVLRRNAVRTAALAAALVGLIGGAVTVAPSAAAVGGHSKCTTDHNSNGKVDVTTAMLRSGPGTSYSSYGQLSRGTRVYITCSRQTDITRQPWLYLKVQSGANSGMKGWVRDDLVYWPM